MISPRPKTPWKTGHPLLNLTPVSQLTWAAITDPTSSCIYSISEDFVTQLDLLDALLNRPVASRNDPFAGPPYGTFMLINHRTNVFRSRPGLPRLGSSSILLISNVQYSQMDARCAVAPETSIRHTSTQAPATQKRSPSPQPRHLKIHHISIPNLDPSRSKN